jgi:hypothetical protein
MISLVASPYGDVIYAFASSRRELAEGSIKMPDPAIEATAFSNLSTRALINTLKRHVEKKGYVVNVDLYTVGAVDWPLGDDAVEALDMASVAVLQKEIRHRLREHHCVLNIDPRPEPYAANEAVRACAATIAEHLKALGVAEHLKALGLAGIIEVEGLADIEHSIRMTMRAEYLGLEAAAWKVQDGLVGTAKAIMSVRPSVRAA